MRAGEHLEHRLESFRRGCAEKGLACTHQRQVIYRVLASSDEHLTPETVYERVRREIPSISLATVYKSIKTFTAAGLLHEVSPLHESLRLDANLDHHHHLICLRCKSVTDLAAEALEPVRWKRRPPKGFRAVRSCIEILGLCPECAGQDVVEDFTHKK